MSHWLIVYDRAAGQLKRCTEYTSERSGELALQDRFQIERQFPQLEVVVLGADSLDTLRQTHSRYFAGEQAPEGER